jgi:sugar lactone lactonase YvrE
MPFIGLGALIWFLVRVVPKPSRATYPCQRVAFPLASGFIVWLFGLLASATAFKKARKAFSRAKYVTGVIFVVISISLIWTVMTSPGQKKAQAHEPIVHNSPIGHGRGVYPGRVAWIHDADAATWPGSLMSNDNAVPPAPYWHEDVCTDPDVVVEMMSKALRALTGKSSDEAAWDAIFKNFNQQMGRGYVGYTSGEKIAIKINWVLMLISGDDGTKNTNYYDQIDNAPQLAIALLRQLIDNAGVAPEDICIGDPQNYMSTHWYEMVHDECPDVVYLCRAEGNQFNQSGRTPVAPDYDAEFYFSDPESSHWSGVTQQDYIPDYFAQADYFINFPILKSHDSAGMTVCGKNFYGSLMRAPNASGYYNMHWTRPHCADNPPLPEVPGIGNYRANVDLMGHPKLGGKTLLILVDFLYAGRSWDSRPIRWDMAPFNGNWPSSIFLSQDQVAADSVAFDFMDHEWDESVGTINGYPQYSGTDDYLHEAALIPDPCSGANYDPNHDGGLMESLGVHEHWNNATDKQYSRNLDPVEGAGIELVTAPSDVGDLYRDGVVDFRDFAKFAAVWRSQEGDGNWDAACDISIPSDGVIDEEDLAEFCSGWCNVYLTDLIESGASLQTVYTDTDTSFEGPMWDPHSGKLFFSQRGPITYQTLRLDSTETVTAWRNPSPNTNGMFLSLDGRMLACDESTKEVVSIRIDESGPADIQVLADAISDGFTKMPNDLCQLANGNIYFTTPAWDGSPASAQGVWLLEPDGTVTRVNNTINQPNGIMNSLDGKKLYVSAGSTVDDYKQWWVFDINPDGTLSAPSVFFDPASSPTPSNVPDGMTIDELGNLYFAGLGRVWIVSPAGELLDYINMPTAILNVTFGGPNGRTLYMTCYDYVYSMDMNVRGGANHSW